MQAPDSAQSSELHVEAEPAKGERKQRTTAWMLTRLLLGIIALLLVVAFIASRYRPELEALGNGFVARFGLVGMSLGTFIADGFHFPVPPQFYMLLAIASGGSQTAAFAAICAGSLIGGATGFLFSRQLSRVAWIARRLERSSHAARGMFTKYGYRAVVLASITPIAYSMLCYLAGVYRMPKRAFALLSLLRIPRLVLFYYLVRLGWAM